jgi:hypothetical protein
MNSEPTIRRSDILPLWHAKNISSTMEKDNLFMWENPASILNKI